MRSAHRFIGDDRMPRGFRWLLADEGRPEYPAEYLYTRLRGRRAKLISNWKALVYSTEPSEGLTALSYRGFARERTVEGMWRSLLQEHQWVFRQMDESLREVFSPYFMHAELRTLFVCLRSLAGENRQKTVDALNHSLLSERMRSALGADDADTALRETEEVLCRVSPRFAGVTKIFQDKGARAVEQELTHRLFAAILDAPLHPVMRQFFERLADARNILTLYASLRAGRGEPVPFLAGGTIGTERLAALREKNDLFSVLPLVKRTSGITVHDPEPTQVEVALYRGVTKFAKAKGRDPLGVGLILDYLWRCSLEVTNLSLLFAGKDLDREMVMAELL